MYLEQKPTHHAVARYVDCFWISHNTAGEGPSDAIIMPDGAIDLVFSYSAGRFERFVCGAMSHARTVHMEQGDVFFGVRFWPAMASVAFGLDGAALKDTVDWLPFLRRYDDLEMMLPLGGMNFSAMADYAQGCLMQDISFDEDLRCQIGALGQIETQGVSEFAASMGWSRKKLYRDFTRFYGLAPRTFINVRRFMRLREITRCAPHTDLSQLALMVGYYDQADMNRHVKRLTGLTPRQLLSQSYNTGEGG